MVRKFSISGSLAVLVVLLAAVPLFFVLYNSFSLSAEQWAGLWSERLPGLISNTLLLAALVAFACLVLGVSTAWIVTRRDFAGRKIVIWLMVLPLTIPTYVLAHIYTVLLEDNGWLGQAWTAVFGKAVSIPDMYNVFGATFVLALAGFSYVFLLTRTALMRSSRSLEDAARIQGATGWQVFFRVNLPMLRPALAAALAVVVLHTLSDFGAVSMLGYDTFTRAIYLQMTGRNDFEGATGLSLVLVIMSLTFLVFERVFRSRQRYYSGSQTRLVTRVQASRAEKIMIWSWVGLIVTLSFGLPLAWMLAWTWKAVSSGSLDAEFWGYAWNSVSLAGMAATITLVVALPIALYHYRSRSVFSTSCVHLSSVGFVLPGPVIALGVLSFVVVWLQPLMGTLAVLVIALVIRFLPLAVQAQEASLQQLTPSITQVGRILGAGPFENLRRVILPMIKGGLISAWVLVFIDALKELPATLIMRPTGFDTLPVRIWIEASEEMLELAAPAMLMLVVATLPVIWFLMRDSSKEH